MGASADGTATATGSGGSGAISYSWTGPNGFTATGASISGLDAGTYTVTAMDGAGSTATDNVTITDPNSTYYADGDGDSYGDAANSVQACSQPAGFVTDNTDCNDGVGAINPGATEVCDGIDNNCDGNTDEGFSNNTYYADNDGDGYGDANNSVTDCVQPAGYVTDNTDCNDGVAAINPGAVEVCDGIDNNCDGNTDEGLTATYYADTDGDGYGDAANSMTACSQPVGYVTNDTDCNDGVAAINPGATEVCDGLDNNCDGNTDEGLTQNTYYADTDGDGYGDPNNAMTACVQPVGYVTDGTDCHDGNPAINPGAAEVCDGVDNNCDGNADEGLTFNTYYADADGDGYGDASNSTSACSQPTGYVTDNTDCNDGVAAINPGAAEVCDGIDNNCDGNTDEGLTFTTYYADTDGDGYGDPASSISACSQPAGYVTDNTDCHDGNPEINPGATEVCDGEDNNCDGATDDLDCTGCTYSTIDFNDFEAGWGIWNDGGSDAARSSSSAYANSGIYTIRLRDNTSTSVMTTDVLDLSAYEELTIDFAYHPVSMDNGNEDFWLQISTNGGASYTTVEEWNQGDEFVNNQQYTDAVVIAGPFTTNTSLRFRCDASGNSDWVYIDDVSISGCSGGSGDPCVAAGGDGDGDGVCANDDCDDSDPNVGATQTPGTTCDDGDANTTGDVIQADGCTCAGTVPGPCDSAGGDSDGDGVCANDDCDDSDPNVGAAQTPGTTCDDGNANTIDDVIQADGCTCSGTSIGGCTYVTIDSNDFESGWGTWNDGGSDCRRSINDAAWATSGSYAVRLRDNTSTSVMTTDVLDLSGYDELTVDFAYHPVSMETGEDFWLQISTNGGASYTTVGDWNSGTEFVNNQSYTDAVVIVGPFTANTTLRFRCDASANNDRVYIDDVVITGCSNVGGQMAGNDDKLKGDNTTIVEDTPAFDSFDIVEQEQIAVQNRLTVYPNPVSEQLTVEFAVAEATDIQLIITDINGRMIQQQTIAANQGLQSTIIEVNNYAAGYYLLHILTDSERLTQKFVVVK